MGAARSMWLLAGFPNPVNWAVDQVKGFISGAATESFELIIAGLTAWVLDAVVWIVGGVFTFFLDATDPNVQADWFVADGGPYAMTATIGATLLVGFLLAGITQGVFAGDVGGMLRRMALDLPVSVLGMVGLVGVTQALIRVVDALSMWMLETFAADVDRFTDTVASLTALGGGVATAFVVFVLGIVAVIAGLILVAELVVRAALIYLVVALAPLVFAAQVWPALRGMARKLLDLLVALIVSKLVIAVALAVAAAAVVGVGSGGEVTALPEPEVAAEDAGGSVTQGVGILLAAIAAFGVSAFSPLLVARLLPITEAAAVGQGLRGGPLRAGQQAASVAHATRSLRGRSGAGRVAKAGAGSTSSPSAAGAGSAGGAGGAAAAGAAGAAAGVGVQAAGRGARTMTGTATEATPRHPAPRPNTKSGDSVPDERAPRAPRRGGSGDDRGGGDCGA